MSNTVEANQSPVFVRQFNRRVCAMKGCLQTFFIFLHLAHGQPRHKFMAQDPFDDDSYPQELNVVTRHCSEERLYKHFAIFSVHQDLSFEFYRNINEGFGIPTEVFNDINKLNSVRWQSCVLLYLSNEQFFSFLESVDTYRWKPTNVYVLRTPESAFESQNNATSSYEYVWSSAAAKLWRKNNVHKFVLSMNGSNLVFDPFAPSTSNLQVEANSSLTASFRVFGAPKDLGDSADLLRERDTFAGYEVSVALFPYVTVKKENGIWSGMEAYAMNEICYRMNVTPRIFEPPETFGWLSNGTFTGTLGMLVYRQSDLAFNGFFIKDYRAKDLEFSMFLDTDKICVMVPKRGRIPEYLLIARIFSFYSWALIIVGNSFVALTYMGMTGVTSGLVSTPLAQVTRKGPKSKKPLEKFSANLKGPKTLTRVARFLALWVVRSLHPMHNNTKWSGERLHIALGLMLGIVTSGCFTSQLASSFSNPAFLKDIDTLGELDDSGLEVLTSFPNLLDDVFADDEMPTFINLQMKLKLKNVSEIMTQFLKKRNAGYLDRKHVVILAGNLGEEQHVVPDYPKEYHLAYPITKGSPFLPRINAIVGRLHNGGFYKKWFLDMKKPPVHYTQKPVVIRLPHLCLPFFLLFVGLVVSGAVFLYELKHPSVRAASTRGAA